MALNISDRIEHIFQFMEYERLTEKEHDLVISFEEFHKKRGFLTEKQLQILESIFKRAAERSGRDEVNFNDD